MENTQNIPLQWHPAFFAGIQIELEEEADKLIFENEHQLGTKPKQIDVLIIKKHSEEQIQKNIGRIFRTHNIIEYKSPEDYLSIDDFYLVYGYACLYKSDTVNVNAIPANEITLSFVCSKFPKKLIQHLKNERLYRIEKQEKGVYYVKGDFFPIQIIHTKGLSKENNFWLHNLTNDIKKQQDARKIIAEYQKHRENKLYSSIMNIIISANKNEFKEVTDMCEALEELIREKIMDECLEAFEKQKQSLIDAFIAEKDASIAEKDASIAEKDASIAEKDASIAEKDAFINKQALRIAELEAQLAKQSLL